MGFEGLNLLIILDNYGLVEIYFLYPWNLNLDAS